MTRRNLPPPIDIAFALGAGAAAAVVFAVLLTSLSAPKDFDDRIATLTDQTTRAEAMLRPVRDRGRYGPEALCTRDATEQARILRDLVSAQTTQGALVLDSLETRIEPAPDLSTRVTPVRLRLSVTGSYEGAVGLLALLARERPQLFVDSLDLTPKVSNVTLSLSGRVFCGA